MFEDNKRRELSQFGKFKLQEALSANFKQHHSSSIAGLQEDASVINAGKENSLLSSKIFVENIHFDLAYFPLRHLGYKCLAVVLADIAAMNGTPSQARINIAVSNRFSVEAMEELMGGIRLCCNRYEIDLTGLDITAAPAYLTISVDILGKAAKSQTVMRNGAKEKELICVSGDLGAAYTGLILLEREKKVFEANPNAQPDLSGYDYVLERQLKPEPRLDIIKALEKEKVLPTSMINISDGLASALLHLCNASNKGCIIYEGKLPIDILAFNTLKELSIVATTIALNGGEDYELLFTIKQDDFEKIQNVENISIIGYMQEPEAGRNLVTNDEHLIELKAQGFGEITEG